jgi:chromosome segregation ATPase
MASMDEGPQSAAELAGFAGRVAQEAADRAEAKLQHEVARLRHESLRWLGAQSRELVALARAATEAEAKRDARVNLKALELDEKVKQMEAATEEMRQAVRSLGAEVGGRLEEQRARIAELERAVRELSVKVEHNRSAPPRPLSIPRTRSDASVLDLKPGDSGSA